MKLKTACSETTATSPRWRWVTSERWRHCSRSCTRWRATSRSSPSPFPTPPSVTSQWAVKKFPAATSSSWTSARPTTTLGSGKAPRSSTRKGSWTKMASWTAKRRKSTWYFPRGPGSAPGRGSPSCSPPTLWWSSSPCAALNGSRERSTRWRGWATLPRCPGPTK